MFALLGYLVAFACAAWVSCCLYVRCLGKWVPLATLEKFGGKIRREDLKERFGGKVRREGLKGRFEVKV